MAESSRKVRKTKDGRKIVTRTNRKGQTISQDLVLAKKCEDGKRTVTSKFYVPRTRTKASGNTVKKRTNKLVVKRIISRTNAARKNTQNLLKQTLQGKVLQKITRTNKER